MQKPVINFPYILWGQKYSKCLMPVCGHVCMCVCVCVCMCVCVRVCVRVCVFECVRVSLFLRLNFITCTCARIFPAPGRWRRKDPDSAVLRRLWAFRGMEDKPTKAFGRKCGSFWKSKGMDTEYVFMNTSPRFADTFDNFQLVRLIVISFAGARTDSFRCSNMLKHAQTCSNTHLSISSWKVILDFSKR